jgi:hypothetical protein
MRLRKKGALSINGILGLKKVKKPYVLRGLFFFRIRICRIYKDRKRMLDVMMCRRRHHVITSKILFILSNPTHPNSKKNV